MRDDLSWIESPFTGFVTSSSAVPRRPHDADVALWAAALAPGGEGAELAGGAAWTLAGARAAALGEAVERGFARAERSDRIVEASFADLPRGEDAIAPSAWALFHPEQYASPGFPFAPFGEDAVCSWITCRRIDDGSPAWVPADMVFLAPTATHHVLAPATSTGLSAGSGDVPVVLRGLQEVIERDAVVGAFWDRHPLEEWPAEKAFSLLGDRIARRVRRPNLRPRFYRIDCPWSAHVTAVTLEGEDREGPCFSIGSACRETRAASFEKALIEAVQGRSYVRALLATLSGLPPAAPSTFPEHAVHYTRSPRDRERSALSRARAPATFDPGPREGLADLVARLGPEHRPLFRILTPRLAARVAPSWRVVRVIAPGLTPLHGDHALAHLGSPLWRPRPLREWAEQPPHPFP